MLQCHIKLPKGKVATAALRAAEQAERKAQAARVDYVAAVKRFTEAWERHIEAHPSVVMPLSGVMPGAPFLGVPPSSDHIHQYGKLADKLRLLAKTAKASNGDVYVNAETWHEISGYWPD